MSDVLLAFLANRVIVAHNAPFDVKFITRELADTGRNINFSENYIDTIALLKSSHKYRGKGNSLVAACDYYGIENSNAHTALSDALATAELFKRLCDDSGMSVRDLTAARPLRISAMSVSDAIPRADNWVSRDEIKVMVEQKTTLKPYLDQLVSAPGKQSSDMPDAVVKDYLSQVHRQLINGSYLLQQTQFIQSLIAKHGFSKQNVTDLHEEYVFMRTCGFYANNGNQLTDEHLLRLSSLSEYLQIESTTQDYIIKQTLVESQLIIPKARELGVYFSINSGDKVVLTGEEWLSSKDELTMNLTNFGIVASTTVSTRSKAIISNDPHSLSKKAVRGRELNIPTLSEPTLAELTGIGTNFLGL